MCCHLSEKNEACCPGSSESNGALLSGDLERLSLISSSIAGSVLGTQNFTRSIQSFLSSKEEVAISYFSILCKHSTISYILQSIVCFIIFEKYS